MKISNGSVIYMSLTDTRRFILYVKRFRPE